MSQKMAHGFAWCTYPDVLGLDIEDAADPGHPFASSPGKVLVPEEVLYFRPANSADTGFRNEHRSHTYLVLSKTQHHPRVCPGWDSEPAILAGNFKTEDGKVRIVRIIQAHKRHSGDLLECELKIEED